MDGWAHRLPTTIKVHLFDMLDVNKSWEDLRSCIFRYDGTAFSDSELAGVTCAKDLLHDIWFTELVQVSQVIQSLRNARLNQAANFLEEKCVNLTVEASLCNQVQPSEQSVPSPTIWDESPQQNFHRDFTYEELRQATDDFSETRVLGKGGSATVYFAKVYLRQSQEHLTKVAVKRFHASGWKITPQMYRMYTQDIAALSHKHLLPLIGSSCDHEPLIVNEFMPQGTVREHLSLKRNTTQQPLSAGLRCELILQVSDALAYLHENHLVHQDVKSANILLNDRFHAKLSDFGSAVKLSNDWIAKAPRTYTPGFVAPEYEQNMNAELKKTMDIFSFGVTVLEFLTSFDALITDNEWKNLKGKSNLQDCSEVRVWEERNFKLYEFSRCRVLPLYQIALFEKFNHQALCDDKINWVIQSKNVDLKNVDLYQEIFSIAINCLNKSAFHRPTSRQIYAIMSNIKDSIKC